MDIYAFTTHYPNIFKPYYDYHFADLMGRGHRLTVFSQGPATDRVSEAFRSAQIGECISIYNPDDLRGLLRHLPQTIRVILEDVGPQTPGGGYLSLDDRSFKNRLKEYTRATLLPDSPPDISIVHSHETMRLFSWLPEKYPSTPIGLYYYGGLPKEVGSLDVVDVRSSFEAVDVVFAPSNYAAYEAEQKGCDADKIRVLPLSFDISDFPSPDGRDYCPGGRLRLMTVARLSKGKGHEYTLRALARLAAREPEVRFVYRIVGAGPCSSSLRKRVRDLGLEDHVQFMGSLPFEEVRRLYRETDAHILASYSTDTWTETQGTVVQESMLMGAIPITTETGGVPESIPPSMADFQVEPRSPEALERAVLRLVDSDTDSLRRLARRGRQWVVENFRIESFNSRLIHDLLKAGNC